MGLDNISPIDRSSFPPELGFLEQADSTAWMAMYALDLLDMALRLALHDSAYEDVATKFFEHFHRDRVRRRQRRPVGRPDDAFFYDVLHLSDGTAVPIKVKSLVGLVPVTAAAEYHYGLLEHPARLRGRAEWYLPQQAGARRRDTLTRQRYDGRTACCASYRRTGCRRCWPTSSTRPGMLSPYGIRSISAWHRDHPFQVSTPQGTATTDYEPAESTTGMFGGNSNWRGPIWFPLNTLLVEALRDYDDFDPGASIGGVSRRIRTERIGLGDIADDLTRRLVSIFLPGPDGRRPVHGTYDLLATDPRWRDNVPFHEYFHGDTGAGLGAEHQTGWTALVAHLILTRRSP